MQIIYTDGGCSGNNQLDISKRQMVAVVTDDKGNVLVEKKQEGGSSNIAELSAVKEALMWCVVNEIKAIRILTDSMNNLKWIHNRKIGKGINSVEMVNNLKTIIDACRKDIIMELQWIPREENLAGHYIEAKYNL